MLYTKSIIPVDESEYLGFYKGGVDEKFTPHLQPLMSAIEYLYRDEIRESKNKEYKMTSMKKFEYLREINCLDVIPLAEIRGMNIFNKLVMLDEAQNTKDIW